MRLNAAAPHSLLVKPGGQHVGMAYARTFSSLGCPELNLDQTLAQTNRLRTEGMHALLAAAREGGVTRFVAQSYASMRNARVTWPASFDYKQTTAAKIKRAFRRSKQLFFARSCKRV